MSVPAAIGTQPGSHTRDVHLRLAHTPMEVLIHSVKDAVTMQIFMEGSLGARVGQVLALMRLTL